MERSSTQKGPLAKGAGILLRKMTGGFLQCVSDGSAILAAAAVESLRHGYAAPPPFSREAFEVRRSAQKGPLEKGAGILLRKMTGGFLQFVLVGTAIFAAAAVESLRFRFAQPPPFTREAFEVRRSTQKAPLKRGLAFCSAK